MSARPSDPFPAFLLALLAGAPAAAAPPQEKPAPELGAPPSASVMRTAHGAALVGDELHGAGPDYKIHFRRGGFELTPALGRAAPRNFPLSFELESIERGGVLVYAPGAPAAPELGADGLVRYAHPFGIEERYEIRAGGVEQSFHFAEPLPGSGELVVRGRLAGDLAATLGEHAELAFAVPGLGGVRFGAVTGIDAAGLTAAGSLRYDGRALELVLPAELVDAAAYPLVLDPLIGTWFVIPGAAVNDESDPDVAYDAGNSLYLVAWHREYSATDYDIHAQRVSTSGASVGGIILIENAAETFAINPTVANVRFSRRFLVAWQQEIAGDYDILGRAVNALDGVPSDTLTLSATFADELDPDACGEQTTLDDDALVVFERNDTGILGVQVALPLSGNPFITTSFTVANDSRAYRPAIAKSGGTAGRALVVYNILYSPTDEDVYGALLDRNGVLLDGPQVLAGSSLHEDEPDVDGDGTTWLVAYEYGSADSEIHCRRVTVNPATLDLSVGPAIPQTDDDVEQYAPAVAWTPGKAFVAWQQYYGTNDYDIYVKGVDPSDCGTCEPTLTMDFSSTWDAEPELATQYSGGSTGDQVFATWYSGVATGGGFLIFLDQIDIKAQRLEAFGSSGSSANLGGGCGAGGSIATSGSIAAGNPGFAVTLSGADPFATFGLLIVKPPSVPFACGGCSVILPGTTFAVPLSGGAASQNLPIPCDAGLVGAQLDAQWAVLGTFAIPCPLFGQVSASARLRLTIGQ